MSFKSSYPVEEAAHPVGEELAKFIYSKLSERSYDLSDFENYEDFARSTTVTTDRAKTWLQTGSVEDGDYEWLLQINSGIGFFKKLFGNSDDEKRDRIAESVDDLLKYDNHFSPIRGHEGDFEEEKWTERP